MKKQLLLGTALLAAISAYPQNGKVKPNGMSSATSAKQEVRNENFSPKLRSPIIPPDESSSDERTSSTTAITWTPIANSMNIYGVVVATSKPLQYNPNLDAISFFHRQGPQYTSAPVNNSGSILARYSTNWGSTWDSTVIWSNGTNLGRYPSGALYGTSMSNAYAVGIGPVTTSGWAGEFFASKQLGSSFNNNTASSATLAQQFMPNTAPYGTIGRSDDPLAPLFITDDGKAHAIGLVPDAAAHDTAINVITGTFNAGVFNWTGNRITPPFVTTSTGDYGWWPRPIHAWNKAGTVGYIVCLGVVQGATRSNRGYQPIVYKTTNSGATWSSISNIDFNSPVYDPIKNALSATNADTSVTIPSFSMYEENVDAIVDGNNKLHIFSTVNSGTSGDADSLGYRATYYTGTSYTWPHKPGARPYLYDFITDGTAGWRYLTVDSMSSEFVEQSTGNPGFNENPWDQDATGLKVRYGARLQMSRTPDGQHIVYSWTESDTLLTNSNTKFNILPNIKVRMYSVALDKVSNNEINVTKNTPQNVYVANRAMFHNLSPTSSTAQVSNVGNATVASVTVPITVSTSNPYQQLATNDHYYSSAPLTFSFLVTGVKDNGQLALDNSNLYPNPAKNSSTLFMQLNQNSDVAITISNTIGQVVKTIKTSGVTGENNINLSLDGLSSGIYLVNIKTGNASGTKKLIIQ